MPAGGAAAAAMAANRNKRRARAAEDSSDEEDADKRAGYGGLPGNHAKRPPSDFCGQFAIVMRQEQVRRAYQNPTVQWLIAGLIMGNFLTNIVEKQIDPWGTKYPDKWKIFESVWNIIFIFELIWNAWGSWNASFRRNNFLCSGWNLFDCLVVFVSIPSLLGIELPGPMAYLRMLRAFRVFRLFKRIKSLNKIIQSLIKAVPGVANAFLIMIIFMAIYAILAVEFFATFGVNDAMEYSSYNTVEIFGEAVNISSITARGMPYGKEYFGDFWRAIYTMWQVSKRTLNE